jgi:hypothetical protein
MGKPHCSGFNQWKKLWVVGFLKKKDQSIIQRQNQLEQVQDGPLPWQTEVGDFLTTFKTWLSLVNLDNAEWIHLQSVEMFLTICANEI